MYCICYSISCLRHDDELFKKFHKLLVEDPENKEGTGNAATRERLRAIETRGRKRQKEISKDQEEAKRCSVAPWHLLHVEFYKRHSQKAQKGSGSKCFF